MHGNDFSGRAGYGSVDYLECEWGVAEDGIFIEDNLICNSQIKSIEEIVPHGSAELWTEYLVLRRYRPDDPEQLYQQFGTDPEIPPFSHEDYEIYRHTDTGKWFAVFIVKERSAFGLDGGGEAEILCVKPGV